MSQRLEFRILGPFEVRRDGRVVELPGGKPRALLALLLLHRDQVVPVDRLVDEIWPGRAPPTAAKNVQVYVARLRKALGEGELLTHSPGYVLRIGESRLDADRFCTLVEEARHERPDAAAEKLRTALALWHGPALVDFSYDGFAQDEIRRLEELRLGALEDRIDADLSLGRDPEVVTELEVLVSAQPLRERLRGQLMVALYRCGRQAEGLEVYQAGRRLVVDELGLEPGAALRRLERAILAQDPALGSIPIKKARRDVRKTVTIVCAELTAGLGDRLDPESLRKVIDRSFEMASASLVRHGATVERSVGDAVTAVFGIPVVHEDDAFRAVRAAMEMQDALAGLNADFKRDFAVQVASSIGISTGEVIAGGRGLVSGEAVTVAARLAHAAAPGGVMLGESTFRIVRDWVRTERVEPLSSKGAGAPLPAARLLELLRVPAPRRWLDAPMVGRERDRRLLEDAFEQSVSNRACQLFTLLGVAGVGKSRLATEFVEDLRNRATIARGRCLPYGEGITYWAVAEVVKELAGLDGGEAPHSARQKLRLLLEGEEDAELIEARVAEVIGLSEATAGSSEDGFWGVRKLLEALARRSPLVVIFDDLHWAEPTFLDLVENIADWSLGAPILVLCIARPELLELRPRWGGGKLNATSVLLEPLSNAEAERLIQNLLEARIDADAIERIVEAGDGNPLFIEEMLAMLIDDGLLRRGEDRWIASQELASVPIPPSVQALLAARLDRLSPDERAVLERASVEGMFFHRRSVEQLAPETPSQEVDASLMALARRELIRPERTSVAGEQGFRFRHVLIRNAAYEGIPKELRAGLHERFASWLEYQAAERIPDEILGYHLEQAYRHRAELGNRDIALAERAAERLAAAGQAALNRGDVRAGGILLGRAIELLPERHPRRLELLPAYVIALPTADTAMRAVRELQGSDDARARAYASFLSSEVRLFAGDAGVNTMAAAAESARAVFAELGDERGLAYSERALAQVCWFRCRASAALEAFERARVHAETAGLPYLVDDCLTLQALMLFNGPVPTREATVQCERLHESARGRVHAQAAISLSLGALHGMRGEIRRARELVRPAAATLREMGLPSTCQISYVFAADVEEHAHDLDAAERLLREGLEELDRLDDRAWSSTVSMLLAHLLARQGRDEEAQAMLQVAREGSSPDDIINIAGLGALEGLLLARRGGYTEAERLAMAAVATAETTDMPWVRGTAAEQLGAVLALADRRDEARSELERALKIYEARGDAPHSRRLREKLAGLT